MQHCSRQAGDCRDLEGFRRGLPADVIIIFVYGDRERPANPLKPDMWLPVRDLGRIFSSIILRTCSCTDLTGRTNSRLVGAMLPSIIHVSGNNDSSYVLTLLHFCSLQ